MAKVATVPVLNRGDSEACIARFGYEPRTVGVPLLPPDVSESVWLDLRKKMLTASEVAAVFGRGHTSAFSLWWQKQPGWPGVPQTAPMHIGRKLESVIGELWSEAHPEAALYRTGAALWGHDRHGWLGATPDYVGVFPVEGGVYIEPVECKSDEGGEGWGRAWTDEVPFHHKCQVLTQALVLGTTHGRLIRLSGKRVTEYRVGVDENRQLADDIVHSGQAFVASLESGITPDIDGHASTEEALKTLYSSVDKGVEESIPDELADVFEEAYGQVKAWEARLADARNRIRERMGRSNAQYGVRASDGTRVVTRSHYKRNGYTVGPCEVDQIRKA